MGVRFCADATIDMNMLGSALVSPPAGQTQQDLSYVARELHDFFGVEFALWNERGELLRAGSQSWLADQIDAAQIRGVEGAPQLIDRSCWHLRLALPLVSRAQRPVIATADFLRNMADGLSDQLADLVGDADNAEQWLACFTTSVRLVSTTVSCANQVR